MSVPQNTFKVQGTPFNTTNGTGTSAITFATRANKAYVVRARVTAVRTSDFLTMKSMGRLAGFVNHGGTLVQIGATQYDENDIENTASSDANISLSANGTNIVLTAWGIAATNLTWLSDLEITEVGQLLANGGMI
jgi:hypothetical protein